MKDEDMIIVFEDERTSIYPTLISSIISIIVVGVLVWMLFEAIRLVQAGDYSLFIILLVIVLGAVLIIYPIIMKDDDGE